MRQLAQLATGLALSDCLSVLPPGTVQPEHVAHLTSLHVVAAETRLRDLLTAATKPAAGSPRQRTALAADRGLDETQAEAASAIASTDPLVIVEGAAGAGKTTMLGAAITAAEAEGRATRIVTPTKKAADVAARELGVSPPSRRKAAPRPRLALEQRWRVDPPPNRATRDPDAAGTCDRPSGWATQLC